MCSVLSAFSVSSRLLAIMCIAFAASNAQAVLINFDDIPYVQKDPEGPALDDVVITDQYASKGLLVDDGYLGRYTYIDPEAVVSQPHFLLGGNFVTLSFIGELPTSVSMYVSSFLGEAIFLNAYLGDDLIEAKRTAGRADLGPDSTDYTPKQLVAFDAPTGISSITIEGYFNMRTSALIDDLSFTRSVSVPEPSSWWLMALGLIGLGLKRLRNQL